MRNGAYLSTLLVHSHEREKHEPCQATCPRRRVGLVTHCNTLQPTPFWVLDANTFFCNRYGNPIITWAEAAERTATRTFNVTKNGPIRIIGKFFNYMDIWRFERRTLLGPEKVTFERTAGRSTLPRRSSPRSRPHRRPRLS